MATGTNRVPVTSKDCTRFFMTAPQAVDLIFRTKAGELNIPELPAYKLEDLAEAMEAKMDIFGLPAHEKKHEGMADGNTSDKARRMTVDELKEALNAAPL